MRKVMIVDDESWIRRGIIGLIPWESLQLELVGEAEDGEEAYALMLAKHPDILFLDMRMPGWDGKQLLRKLSQSIPGLITIVISGYSDFAYTKEAIRQRAFEYLLKPVKREEMLSVLEKALAELDQRDKASRLCEQEAAEEWVRRSLLQPMSGDGSQELPGGLGRFAIAVGRPDESGTTPIDGDRLKTEAAQFFAEPQPSEGGTPLWTAISSLENGRETVVAFRGERLELNAAAELLQAAAARFRICTGSMASFGLSAVHEGLFTMQEAYQEARRALGAIKVGARGQIQCFVDEGGQPVQTAYPSAKEHAILMALETGNAAMAAEAFDSFLEEVGGGTTATIGSMQRSMLMLLHSLEKWLNSAGIDLEKVCGRGPQLLTNELRSLYDPKAVSVWFGGTILKPVLAAGNSGEKQGETIIQDVLKQIETEYYKQLTLHEISEKHHLHPDYFSRLFKRVKGTNFVDYLTDYRICKAKHLLLTTNHKNYEIAMMVGYEDYRYFSQVFKKRTGMTIGEFRSGPACRKG